MSNLTNDMKIEAVRKPFQKRQFKKRIAERSFVGGLGKTDLVWEICKIGLTKPSHKR